MFCKWCGMESKDHSKCEWCGRPFSTQTTESIEAGVPPQTTAMPSTQHSAPQATAAMAPADNDDNLPFNPKLSRLKQIVMESTEIAPISERLEKYFGVMLILLAAGTAAAQHFPEFWLVPFFSLVFLSGLLLGVFRVVGYYENNISDVLLLLVITMFMGPVYGTAVYGIISLLKRETNYALLALMASFLVVRLMIGSAAHGFGDTIAYMGTFEVSLGIIPRILQLFPICLLVGGWMCASCSRPLNE